MKNTQNNAPAPADEVRDAYRDLLVLHHTALLDHGPDVAAGVALAVSVLARRFPALADERALVHVP